MPDIVAGLDRFRWCSLCALVLSSCLLCTPGAAAELTSLSSDGVQLLVLDIEMTGDLTGTSSTDYEARTRSVSNQLRDQLNTIAGYAIVDAEPLKSRIEQLRSLQYLHKCNGCELDLATELRATHVLVAWVHRVSQLISTLKFEIREAHTGRVVRASAFDFRGDNYEAWSRAVNYMVRDLASFSSASEARAAPTQAEPRQ